ncbi:hypothetical protein [Actinokineospora enzanensis]|uniref:hypothetical protein n=1 Tax=Actinokineospora enzanensis TaxID=155975 RepID=UPI0003752F5E|nr:hypothetical protein [Actinokineospora enzanensis]
MGNRGWRFGVVALVLAVVAGCSDKARNESAAVPTTTTPTTTGENEQIGCLTTGAAATTTPATPQSFAPRLRVQTTQGSAAVWAEIQHELSTYQKSDYQHTTSLDRTAGTYIVDCSGWGNVLLRIASCNAYGDLVQSANAARKTDFSTSCQLPTGTVEHGPYAVDWASMLAKLTPGQTSGHWTRVAHVPDLVPGDVVTYALGPGAQDTGHVMFVAGTPTVDPQDPTQWRVPIADSTASEHGPDDSRAGNSRNVDGKGIGSAALELIVDGGGAPTDRFRWYPGAPKIDQVPAPVMLGHFG